MTSTATPWNDLKKRLADIKPAIATFTICDDSTLREQLADAKKKARDAEAAWTNWNAADDTAKDAKDVFKQRLERAQTELAQAQAAFDTQAVTLRFQALPREELEALERKHPATEEQEADGDTWNKNTFPPALIAAASLDGMPLEDAAHFMARWPLADFRDLWSAAYGVQSHRRTDLGKG
jgi:hypothetical protein